MNKFIIFICVLLLCNYSNCSSSSSSNSNDSEEVEVINIYFSSFINSNNGGGNGTISNPYNSSEICNFYTIFKNGNLGKINDTIININFGFGVYDTGECFEQHSEEIIGFSNVTIQSYKDSTSNLNSTVDINNFYIDIIQSTILFSNSINIQCSGIHIENKSVIYFENISLSFIQGSDNTIDDSRITFINSNILNYSDITEIHVNSSLIIINNSNASNFNIVYTDGCCFGLKNTGIQILNSTIVTMIIESFYFDLLIDNSILIDTNINVGGYAMVSNSNITSSSLVTTSVFQIFNVNGPENHIAQFSCINTTINFILNENNPFKLVLTTDQTNIEFTNVSISNYQTSVSMIELFGSETTFTATMLTVKNCISPSFIDTIMSNVNLKKLKLIGNTFFSLVNVYQSFQFKIESTNIKCSGDNNINQVVTMNSIILQSNLEFLDFKSKCIGTYSFINSNILFENVEIDASSNQDYIEIKNGSTVVIKNSVFNSNLLNSQAVLFSIEDSSSTLSLYNCNIGDSSTSIISGIQSGLIIIDNVTFSDIISNSMPTITSFGSNMFISNSFFKNSGPQIFQIDSADVAIINTFFANVGTKILSSDYFCSVSIINSTISNCFTQTTLFSFSTNSSIEISNSLFFKNHGYGYQLISIFFNSTATINNCTFSENSFSPMISSSQSEIELNDIHLLDFTGSFYKSELDDKSIINQFKYTGNSVPIDYLFYYLYCKEIQITNMEISNNYFTQYLLLISFAETVEFINVTFQDNTFVSANLNQPYSSPITFETAVLIFYQCGSIGFNHVSIIENEFSSTVIYVYQSIISIYQSCSISNNTMTGGYTSFVFSLFQSDFSIVNSQLIGNQGTSTTLIISNKCNITINNSELSYNQFPNGIGSVLFYLTNYEIDSQSPNSFTIVNSRFERNIGKNGSVFSLWDEYENSLITFNNNTFISNTAIQQGGVFYTFGNFKFKNNMTQVKDTNTFISNKAIYGNEFSSDNYRIGTFYNQILHVENNVDTIIRFKFLDCYDQIYKPFSNDNVKFNITNKSNRSSEIVYHRANLGIGEFYYTFIGVELNEYTIECLEPTQFEMKVIVKQCLPFQSFDNITEQCSYCPIGQSAIESTGKCFQCNQFTTCLGNIVSSQQNYYMVDQDVSNVIQCSLDTCNSENICTNQLNTGLLCYQCIDPDYYSNDDSILVESKNGIQCCKYFEPLLTIPLILIFLIFSLVLSWFKNNVSFISIVIFIQINSVIFYSYSGIYFIPLFRLSIDMLDGYCLFKSLNFNHKSIISYSIIISLFLIGLSDITFKLLSTINNYFKDKIIFKLSFSPVREKKSKIQSVWSLIQVFLIPLIFISTSSIISKTIKNINYLAVDFSIDYNSSFNQFLISISVICFIIISISIIFILYLNFIYLKTSTRVKLLSITKQSQSTTWKIQQILSKSHYKQSYKWWDLIIIGKSFIYCILSISMLFESNLYLAIVISIQLVYSISYFLLNPLEHVLNQFKDLNNFINLLQLIIFIILDSSLLHLSKPHQKGIVISCFTFTSVISILCYKYFYLNFKNIKNIIKPTIKNIKNININ